MNLLQRYNDNHFWERMEFYRFSIMMFTITFGTALASVALYYLFELQNSAYFIPVAIVSFFAMGANAAAIAQSPLKWVVTIFTSSVFLSIFFIFYAFFI
ncbi:MAG: hypothetical protein ISP71_00075 [Flavobacteriales bacterium]|nr:hypothetical protein [Flavobacteriales bacterium]